MYINRIDLFYNNNVLNIFCDASISKTTGCYGVAAVCMDNIIDTNYRIVSNTTNNNSELKGLRSAISMANKYKYNFQTINIFSDSQISIFGLRDYIYKWKFNPKDGLLYGSSKNPIINQSIFIEAYYMLKELNEFNINIYHQAGHVDNTVESLNKAYNVFLRSNGFAVDLNTIRYISTYNNFVDMSSRDILKSKEIRMKCKRKVNFCDPISFKASGNII